MKFLLEFVTCCASAPRVTETRRPPDKTRLLVMQQPRRRVLRKYGKVRGGGREWRPSLSSISEDALASENSNAVQQPVARCRWRWRRSLERKFASLSPRHRSRSFDHEDSRRPPISASMIAFSPAPFMY